jgi:hypothetical protein
MTSYLSDPKNLDWQELCATGIAPMYRSGLPGVWDAIVAWWKGRDRYAVATPIVFSVWVKSVSGEPMKVEIAGVQAIPVKEPEPDTSDIPEAGEEWFQKARVKK